MTATQEIHRAKFVAFETYLNSIRQGKPDTQAFEDYLAHVRHTDPQPINPEPPAQATGKLKIPALPERRDDPTAKVYRRFWP